MDIPNQIAKPKNCSKHNQQIIMMDPNPKKGGYCLICIQEKTGMIATEDYIQKLNIFINQSEEQCNTTITLLQNWHNSIVNYKSSLNQSLDKILKVLLGQIETFQAFKFKLKNLNQSSDSQDYSMDDLKVDYQQQQSKCEEMKNQVKKQLQDFQSKYFNNLDDLLSILNQKPQTTTKETVQNFQYELIKESCVKLQEDCWAFTFNKDNTIIAIGCGEQIIVYEFNKGVIGKELQRLTNHAWNVTCLLFMNKSNSFVSGSFDLKIISWELGNQNNQWFADQILKEHKDRIIQILLNKDDDLLISGSDDKTIKFWNKISNSWSCIQTIDTKYQLRAISLNELENKLISSGYGLSIISVMKKGSDKKWSLVQTINVSNYGTRLCFTTENQFIFIPFKSNQFQVYNYDQEKQQFALLKKIKIKPTESDIICFPCQYIKQQKILQAKYGKDIYIFKVNQESDYQLIQQTEFKSFDLYGRLSDDGQYLVTWDRGFMQVQVRELKYQQQ